MDCMGIVANKFPRYIMDEYIKVVSVRLPVALWRLIKVHCLKVDMTVKQFIYEAVTAKLKEAEKNNLY
jgi:hypothetical protein